jgi:hypothetical protein
MGMGRMFGILIGLRSSGTIDSLLRFMSSGGGAGIFAVKLHGTDRY